MHGHLTAMDSPLSIAVVVLAIVVAALWLWSARRAAPESADYVKRLENLSRAGAAPPPTSAAALSPAPAPPAPRAAPSGAAIATPAPAASPDDIDDPVCGRLEFVDLPSFGSEWERETGEDVGIPGWVTIEAGPEGPSDLQRACYAALRDRHGDILARGTAVVRAALVERGVETTRLEPSSLFIGPPQPGLTRARGVVYVRIGEGDEGDDGRVRFVSDDDWVTLTAVVEDL